MFKLCTEQYFTIICTYMCTVPVHLEFQQPKFVLPMILRMVGAPSPSQNPPLPVCTYRYTVVTVSTVTRPSLRHVQFLSDRLDLPIVIRVEHSVCLYR